MLEAHGIAFSCATNGSFLLIIYFLKIKLLLRLTKAYSALIITIKSNLFTGEIEMKIYVDADACPVKDIIISEGTNAEIPVILVT
ncbi:MAG: hypothetical protein K0S25_2281, partial [Bacillus sp. (in: firmicutes)]|nr:hypothetical protein [Bacillus sp. (in: firmicutes)]